MVWGVVQLQQGLQHQEASENLKTTFFEYLGLFFLPSSVATATATEIKNAEELGQ